MSTQLLRTLLIFALFSILPAGLRAADAPATAPATQSFTYKKIKNVELKMIVHYPPGWAATDKRPAIVFFFGGGWTNGTIAAFETQADYFAQRGLVTARADYRVKSRQDVTPKECVQDAKSAVRYLRQHAGTLGIDPDRIVASGGSAGGHIAACTSLAPGLDTPDPESAGEDATVSCKANLLILYNPVLHFGQNMMARVNNDQSIADAISPTLHLQKDSPATLLLYGTNDWLLNNGTEYMARCKELSVKCELFTAEGQQHGFFNREPWKERTTKRVEEFLVEVGYLKAEHEEKRHP